MTTTPVHTTTRGFTIWLTGLSGAGKSTIAHRLEAELKAAGKNVEILDGDVVRTDTNIRRIGFVSHLLSRNGVASIVAAISPYQDIRNEVREMIGDFVEVHVHASLDELVKRDVKGLYEKALRGEIANFTGVSDPYEAPVMPEVHVDTEAESVDESVAKIMRGLSDLGYIAPVGDRA